jgi:hypothetical protein
MAVLRAVAALVLFLVGIGVLVALPLAISQAPVERLKGLDPTQLWSAVAMTSGLMIAGAWQIFRGKGRWFAWMSSVLLAMASPGLLRLIGMIPLLALLVELALPRIRKRRGTSPSEADQTEKGAAQSGSQIVEIVLTIGILVACGLCWRLVPEWLRPVVPDDRDGGWTALVASLWLTVFVHELGHAVGGALTGFRLTRFAVFFVEYLRTEKKSMVRLTWQVLGGFYMGIPRYLENLERRQVLMTAAGPAAGFVLSFVCWLVLWRAGGGITGVAFDILHSSMWYSTIMSLANLMPVHLGGIALDGRMIWNILRGNAEARQSTALLACLSSAFSELRPRDWKPEWVEVLRENLDPGTVFLLAAWAEDRLSERPEDAQAMSDLARCSALLGHYAGQLKDKSAKESLLFSRAWIRSRWSGDTDGAEEMMAKASKLPHTEAYELLQLQAALRAAEGETGDALRLLGEAEKELEKEPASGMQAAELTRVRSYREELQRSLGGPVVESA